MNIISNTANLIQKALLNQRNYPLVIGALHLKALPGTPLNQYSMKDVTKQALKEAEIFVEQGVDGIIIENTHDLPYTKASNLDTIVPIAMAVIGSALRNQYSELPIGIQILAGANIEALGVAKAVGLDFIRAEGYVYGHVADEGWIEACAGSLLRYRKNIGADKGTDYVSIFSDIKKKHSAHSITSDVSLAETAEAAEFFLSDGVVITGSATGREANEEDLEAIISSQCSLPAFIGSGVRVDNWRRYDRASGFIVGSYFKKDGHWSSELDPLKIKEFMEEVKKG